MPLFEYHCPYCHHRFERLVRQPTRVTCPSCGSARVEKLLSVPGRPVSVQAQVADRCASAQSAGECCGGGMCGLN